MLRSLLINRILRHQALVRMLLARQPLLTRFGAGSAQGERDTGIRFVAPSQPDQVASWSAAPFVLPEDLLADEPIWTAVAEAEAIAALPPEAAPIRDEPLLPPVPTSGQAPVRSKPTAAIDKPTPVVPPVRGTPITAPLEPNRPPAPSRASLAAPTAAELREALLSLRAQAQQPAPPPAPTKPAQPSPPTELPIRPRVPLGRRVVHLPGINAGPILNDLPTAAREQADADTTRPANDAAKASLPPSLDLPEPADALEDQAATQPAQPNFETHASSTEAPAKPLTEPGAAWAQSEPPAQLATIEPTLAPLSVAQPPVATPPAVQADVTDMPLEVELEISPTVVGELLEYPAELVDEAPAEPNRDSVNAAMVANAEPDLLVPAGKPPATTAQASQARGTQDTIEDQPTLQEQQPPAPADELEMAAAGTSIAAVSSDSAQPAGDPPAPLQAHAAPQGLGGVPGFSLPGEASETGEMLGAPSADSPALSAGEPLREHERRFLRPLLGIDPADVRVHSGAAAQQLAQTLRADAAAIGDDVVLAAGAAGDSPAAQALLAHELTHVARGRRPRFVPPIARDVTTPGGEEQLAEQVEAQVSALLTQTKSAQGAPVADNTSEIRAQPAPGRTHGPQRARDRWDGLPAPWDPLPPWAAPAPNTGSAPSAAAEARPTPAAASATPAEPLIARAAEDRRTARPNAPQRPPATAPSPAEPDLDALARQVYGMLKQRLAAERRRQGW